MKQLHKTSMTLFLATCLSLPIAQARQVEVAIGDGTTTSYYVPYGNYDKNSTTQTIYTQEELGSVAGPIKSIAFDVASKAGHTPTSLKIYIGKSVNTTFASVTDYCDVSSMTLVYEGTPTLGNALGWEEIALQTPYQYDGKSNLVIVIGRQASNWTSSLKYNTTSSTNQCLRRGNDNEPAAGDPSDSSVGYSMMSYRPNIQLLIGEPEITTIGNYTYTISRGVATITSCTTLPSGSLTLPSQITYNGEVIPITKIGANAFEGATELTKVTIPASTTKIDNDVFKGCTALKEVIFSDGEQTLSLGKTSVEGKTASSYPGMFNDCPIETVYLGRNLTYDDTNASISAPFRAK